LASAATRSSLAGRVVSILVSIATALLILGVAILPLLSSQWIHAEQARAGAYVPGFSGADVQEATDETVHQLLVGGDFTFMIHGSTFFDDREVAHMEDVRRVFGGFAALVVGSAVVLVAGGLASRSARARRVRLWRAVGRGAAGLAGLMVVVGVLSVLAFDAMFEVFHELLFPAGSFTFDPARERLVQLFPDQFWADTSLALGIIALTISAIVVALARRRAARLERRIEAERAAAAVIGPAGSTGPTAVRAGTST
jgi:integral membrane protein (TIGR01906 family)